MSTTPRPLPCFPCPHAGACCAWGVVLFPDEAAALRRIFGDAVLTWDDDFAMPRTAAADGRCIFWRDGCTIHDAPYYPRICKGFPWRFADGDDDYPYERGICPELAEDC